LKIGHTLVFNWTRERKKLSLEFLRALRTEKL